MITWALTALAWIIVIVIEWGGVPLPKNWQILAEPFFEKAAWAIAILLVLRAVFWLPFQRHEKEQAKFAAEKLELERTFNEMHDRIEAAHAGIEAAHKSHTELLEAQIQTLQTQLDDKVKRLENGEKLGNLHQLLLSRGREIKKMGASEFCKKYANSKRDEILDPDTQFLFEVVENFLEKEIKGASIAIFENPENFKETPVDKPNYSTISGAMAEVAYRFYTEELYHQRVIDHLNHRASNLMKIIENKGENK